MEASFSKRSLTKWNHIVEAGNKLFLDKGIKAVTVEEVVQTAKVSKATFYKYFPDKEHLLEQILIKIGKEADEKIDLVIKKGKEEGLTKEDFMKIFDVTSYEQLYSTNFIAELSTEYPNLLMKVTSIIQVGMLEKYKELIRLAKVDGIVRLDVDPDVLITYTMMIKKAFNESTAILQGDQLKKFTEHAMELYLYGIFATNH